MTPEGPAEISKTQAQRIDQGNSTTPPTIDRDGRTISGFALCMGRDQQQWL